MRLILLTIAFLIFVLAPQAHAQETRTYHKPNMENFSKMYWGMGLLDIENSADVDNFMRLHECDIYEAFIHNEFEWAKIRESGKDLARRAQKEYPSRYEITQPLLLGEYNLDTKTFDIIPSYQINGIRRFEVPAEGIVEDPCGSRLWVEGYPSSFVVEFNRPFTLTEIPVQKELAKAFVDIKTEQFMRLPRQFQDEERRLRSRDAYLNLRFKVFSYRENIHVPGTGRKAPLMIGMLDSFSVYGDEEKTMLLYEQTLQHQRKRSRMEDELIQKYKALQEQKRKELEKKN